jgi:Ferritin-like domain
VCDLCPIKVLKTRLHTGNQKQSKYIGLAYYFLEAMYDWLLMRPPWTTTQHIPAMFLDRSLKASLHQYLLVGISFHTLKGLTYPMKTPEEMSKETPTMLVGKSSRRSLLRGAVAGAAVGASALWLPKNVLASTDTEGPEDTIVQILSIAATAEQLAVTFYSNGIANANALGIKGDNLLYLKAAVVEEQLHENFLVANGGTSLTSTFSFPNGAATFQDLNTFITTLNQLETDFVAAYLAAVSEFSQYNQPRLAQIAGQILAIESEHRAIGRSISPNIQVPNNRAYAPALLESVGDAVDALSAQGYLSPKSGNSYTYSAVSLMDSYVTVRTPVVAGEDND